MDFLFDEKMEPKIEINVKSLNYERSEDETVPQGQFSFNKFRILSEKTNLQLHNESHFYDATIYRRGQTIGFHGPAATFAYRLRDQDFSYLDSFKWLTLSDVYYYMDRSEVILKGESFAMREPQTMLLTNNFKLNCERHQDYLLNDGEGFLASCLNYGKATPLEGQGIASDFRFFNSEGGKIIDLKGFFKNVEFNQNEIQGDITSLTSDFSGDVLVNTTEIKLTCEKPEDVLKVTPENLVVPCLKNIELAGDFLGAKFLEDSDEMIMLNPGISHKDNILKIDHSDIKFKAKESQFELSSSILKCNTPEEGNVLEAKTFLKGCLNSSEILSKDSTPRFNFKAWEEGPKPYDLEIGGDIRNFTASTDRLQMNSEKWRLKVDKDLTVDFNDVEINCQKVQELEVFDAKEMLANCKQDIEIKLDNFSLRDHTDASKPILAKTKPDVVKNESGKLTINLPELKLVDKEDLTIMEDVSIVCDTDESIDVFIPNKIIGACAKNGTIKVDKLFTDDSDLSVSTLLRPELNIDDIKIEKKKPKIFDIDLKTKDGFLTAEIRLKILGLKSRVEFSGPVNWDLEKEILTIKVEKSRLPLGIKSENIFMFFIKKMLVAEMITYEKGNIIKVAL